MKRSNTILKMVIILIVSILLGTILMMGIYSLPTDNIRNNVENSTSLYEKDENKIDNWIGYLRYGKIDNFTDSIMINMALCREYDSTIENALLNPRFRVRENIENYSSSDISLFLDKDNVSGTIDYGRYWHGYLLYLVPGLLLMNVGGVRMLMMCVEFLLAMLLLYKLSKLDPIYMFAYAITLLFINPITVALNFQNADIYILTLLFSNIILFFNDWLKKNNRYYLLFTLFGILTSFFDFLTYPIVTLGISLVTVLLLNKKDLKQSLKEVILYSISWAFGYLGMWLGKWVVASLLTDTNVIKDAIESVLLRSSNVDNNGSNISFINALSIFKESIDDVPMTILGVLSVVIIIVYMIINKYKLVINKDYFKSIIPFVIVFIIPYAWAFVVRNHFSTHQFLEYRTMAISVLCKLIIIIKLFKKRGLINEQH